LYPSLDLGRRPGGLPARHHLPEQIPPPFLERRKAENAIESPIRELSQFD
jgi:hypothetical protein